MKYFEPDVAVESIQPTISNHTSCSSVSERSCKVESYNIISLVDVVNELGISAQTALEMLDNYLSSDEISRIEDYLKTECDYEEPLNESVDNVDPDSLLDKISDNELKNIAKSAGVPLKGSESKEELTGMVKALSVESVSKTESTKLKRKKGIGKHSKFLQK